MTQSIAGDWELVSETEAGLIVATETYASAIMVVKNRRRLPNAEPTEADEAEAYRTMVAQIGQYTIVGARLIHHRAYTRDPNSTGTDEEFEFKMDGAMLILQSVDSNGTHGTVMTWRKVG